MIKKLKPRRGGFDITYFIADAEEVTSEINARRFGWRHFGSGGVLVGGVFSAVFHLGLLF